MFHCLTITTTLQVVVLTELRHYTEYWKTIKRSENNSCAASGAGKTKQLKHKHKTQHKTQSKSELNTETWKWKHSTSNRNI